MKLTKEITHKTALTFIMYELRAKTDAHYVTIEADFAVNNKNGKICTKVYLVYITSCETFECECIKVNCLKDAFALLRVLGVNV